MWSRLLSVLRALGQRRRFEEGMSEELLFHIEQYTADLIERGVSPEEAARRARIEFGTVTSVKEDCREARGVRFFDELVRELRYAARLLRKTPGFTLTALATVAVCLGANLTIFAVIDSILLRPLPFPAADRLVTMFNTYPKAGVERDGSSVTNYYERRRQIPAFTDVAMYRYETAIVGETGSTEHDQVMLVSPDFFSTLGIGPVRGRSFTEQETNNQADDVAILTDAFWRNRCSADPQMIGKQIRVNGVRKTVVGVLPPGFRFLSSAAELYLPFASRAEQRTPAQRHSGGNSRQMIARLKPDATLQQAQAQIDLQNARLERDDPDAKMMAEAGFRTVVLSLHADHVAAIRPSLLLTQWGALVLLLIGAVNLINLLLVRANKRAKELAVRQALGATRRHVFSEAMVETTLLTLMGGLLGIAVGAAGTRLLATLGVDRLPPGDLVMFDARLALTGLIGAAVLGIVLSAPIVWLNLRGDPANALKSESRSGTASHGAQHLRHGFIVAQIALALVLLSGAGLLGLSLEHAMEVSPGFRADHVLSGQISLPWKNYPSWSARLAFNERLMKDVASQPGVVAAGIVNNVPLSGRDPKAAATLESVAPRPGESPRGYATYGVDGDYFTAMGFSLNEGRFLTAADSRRAERVCVVDTQFARYHWPHGGALGQRLFQGSAVGKDADAFTIVGVVGAVRQAGLTDDETQGAIYYPYALRTDDNVFVVVRSSLAPGSLATPLQRIVRRIDPDLPLNDIRSMETRLSDVLVTRRAPAVLAGVFSAIALLLTAIGTYGVLSYAVAQRGREIGVRMALGARPGQIRSQFLALALRLLTIGTVIGVMGAWLTGRAMQSVLFHVSAFDTPTLAGAAAILVAVSLIACLLPAQRAAAISPTRALAEE